MHTKGPWASGGCVVWEQNGDGICDLTCGVSSNRPPIETEANARLIAAAPDMLDALEEISKSGCLSDGVYVQAIAREAIRKVGGEVIMG